MGLRRDDVQSTRDINCQLCRALSLSAAGPHPAKVDSPMLEAGEFVLIPALGPLVPGHALVVARSHSEGLATLAEDTKIEYSILASKLRAYCAFRNDDLLEAEHGGASVIERGPCISHTHIHLLPGLGQMVRFVEGHLPQLAVDSQSEISTSYVWVSNGTESGMYDAQLAHGQEVRRLLARRLGLDDWDWAAFPKIEMVDETIEYWSAL